MKSERHRRARTQMLLFIWLAIAMPMFGPSFAQSSAQSAQEAYFPKSTFSSNDGAEDSKAARYVACLRGLHEPSLLALTQFRFGHAFRFLWLRAEESPIALRLLIFDESGVGQLTMKVGDGRGNEPGTLIQNKSLPLSKQEVQGFLKLVEQAKFWRLSSTDSVAQPESAAAIPGAEWIVEGVQGDRYHVVDRWSPKDAAYREMALELLRLSGLKVDKIY